MIVKPLVLVTVLVAFAANVNTAPAVTPLPPVIPLPNRQNLIVFGDSVSDSGNTKVLGWPQLPYYNGRYSNGKVWNEYLPEKTGMRLINYAYAAATSDSDLAQGYTHAGAKDPASWVKVPGVKQLIGTFLGESWLSPQDYSISCAALWLNGVNYMYNRDNTAEQVVASIFSNAETLYKAGIRCFLLVDMVDPSKLPQWQYLSQDDKNYIAGRFKDHNALIAKTIPDWTSSHKGAEILHHPINDDLSAVVDQNVLKLQNVKDSCTSEPAEWGSISACDNPGDHAFWDTLHPTTKVHEYFSRSISDLLLKP